MRVDFYRLSHTSPEATLAMLARKSVEAGRRVLVVAEGEERLRAFSQGLWDAAPAAFLANGIAGNGHEARQPILLAEKVEPANDAAFLILADGHWRDPGAAFERVMLVFDEATISEARACWRELGKDGAIQRNFWKQQDDGRWVEGP